MPSAGWIQQNLNTGGATPVLLSGTLDGGGDFSGVVERTAGLQGTLAGAGGYAGDAEIATALAGTLIGAGGYSGVPIRTAVLVGTLRPQQTEWGDNRTFAEVSESVRTFEPDLMHADIDTTPPPTVELDGTIGPQQIEWGDNRTFGDLAEHTFEPDLISGNLSVPLDTEVRVSFDTPSPAPSGTEEFAVLVRKRAEAEPSGDPLCRIELWENGAFVSIALADTPVSSTSGVVLRGVWDAADLADPSGADVECRVVGTGAVDGTLEIGAIEWNAEVATTTYTVTLGSGASGTAAQIKQAQKVQSATATGAPSLIAQVVYRRTLAASSTGTAALTRGAQKVEGATAVGTATDTATKASRATLAATATGTAALSRMKVSLLTLTAPATGTPTQVRQARIVLSVSAITNPLIAKNVGKLQLASASGAATLSPSQQKAVALSATALAEASQVRLVAKTLSASATGTATIEVVGGIIGEPAPSARAVVVGGPTIVRVYSTPRASVGTEGDYGGVRTAVVRKATAAPSPQTVRAW